MRRGLTAGLVVLGAVLAGAPAALAAITVNTTKDELISGDGNCSLREAVGAASGASEPDCPGAAPIGTTTISVRAGTYHLTLAHELFASGNVAIRGPGSDPSQVTIDADGHSRVITTAGQVLISGVTITGGRTFQGFTGDPGFDNGVGGAGGNGGGILNDGTLTLANAVVTGNRTGNGGDGATGTSGSGCPGGNGGAAGSGGGIYNYNHSLTLEHVLVTDNRTGDGGAGGEGGSAGCAGGTGGSGGDGAGVVTVGQLNMFASTIADNAAGNGGVGGLGSAGASLGVGGTGGRGGDGGGVAAESSFGDVSITASTIARNQAGFGGQGGTVASGSTSDGQLGGAGGPGGQGAGIYNAGGPAQTTAVVNSTITGNVAGDGGYGGQGGDSDPGFTGGTGGAGASGGGGGGIYNAFGPMRLASASVAGNSAGGGGGPGPGGSASTGGTPGAPGSAGSAGGGGSLVVEVHLGTAVNEQDSLIAAGTPQNCTGPITDGGHDLSFPDLSCPHSVTGDPKLRPLDNYGGLTQTLALGAGSAAIDRAAGCPSTDQRGVPRPQGRACDIGAYEYAPPVCRPAAASTHGTKPVTVTLSCGDPAALAVQYVIVRGPGHGKLSKVSGNRVTYTARSGFSGTDHFTYRGSTLNGAASPQTATVTVAAVPLVISGVRLSRKRFRAGTSTKLQFTLSLAASVKVAISHRRHGKMVVVETFSARRHAGRDTIAFSGRTLRPGGYKATLVASTGTRRSRPVSLSFVIIR